MAENGDNPPAPPQNQITKIPKFPDYFKDGLFITTAANFSVRFDGNNYPTWRRQVFGLLRCLRLHCLIDGSLTITDSFDPEISRWFDQDSLLQQGMISAFTPSVISSISSATTCREIWVTLETIYANASPARLLNLTERFQQARKGPTESVSDFLHQLKAFSDEITKLGQPVSDAAINGVQETLSPNCLIHEDDEAILQFRGDP